MNLMVALSVGAVLIACGAFSAVWGRRSPQQLVALPVLAAGAAVSLAAVSRFAGQVDPDTGQELAGLVAVAALAATVLGVAWTRRGDAP